MCVRTCVNVCVHATVQVYVTVWTQESLQQKSVSESPCESESQMVMSYCSSSVFVSLPRPRIPVRRRAVFFYFPFPAMLPHHRPQIMDRNLPKCEPRRPWLLMISHRCLLSRSKTE